MSQFPIENLNVNQGDSVFETLYITGKLFYDFSNDDVAFNNLSLNGFLSVGSTATFSSNVSVSGTLNIVNLVASGSITADSYENFQLLDLPVGTSEESTFAPNRILRVNQGGTGYELIDSIQITQSTARSLGVSNDGIIYEGTASIVDNKLQISGISTSSFNVNDKVKVFGVTNTSIGSTIPLAADTMTAAPIPTTGGSTARTYYYWVSEYNLFTGQVGAAVSMTPISGTNSTTLDSMNDVSHVSLTLSRSTTNNGLIIYRQEYVGNGNVTNRNTANGKLIAILGRKELGNSNLTSINWKDYGNYDQTAWAGKGTSNEYIGSGTTTNQIHFPLTPSGHQRGWAIDNVVSLGSSTVNLSGNYNLNSNNAVKMVHDNTFALASVIDAVSANGGNTIILSGGTYLTNKLIIPTGFTLQGSGKNTIIKRQYFGTDLTDGGGNNLSISGNCVGIGTTNGSDVTISNITFDGNNVNNVNFESDSDNYLLYFKGLSSSLFKDIEIRNSSASGLYLRESQRVSVENSTFVDGSLSDRYYYQPIDAQSSKVFRLNDCLIENFPGSVDISVVEVASTGGNIIRNCGTGIDVYATGKITTSNNIILGPADEWFPSPDIYDSDWDGINIYITRGNTFDGPVLQYLEDGNPKDISSTQLSMLSAGIGTMVGLGGTNADQVGLGATFLPFNFPTPNSGTFGRENGYIQLNLTSAQTATLGISSSIGYQIIASEFQNIPTGLSTTVGIATGYWGGDGTFTGSLGGGTKIGSGCTNYVIRLSDSNQVSTFAEGDVVKLVGHELTPDPSALEFTVGKIHDGALKHLELRFNPNPGTTTVNTTGGSNATPNTGFIYKKKVFLIAKGRVGVT